MKYGYLYGFFLPGNIRQNILQRRPEASNLNSSSSYDLLELISIRWQIDL